VIFDEIIDYVETQFGVRVESEKAANVMFMRVNGLDDASLARYINEKYDVRIITKKVEGYKFFNNDWIKIENVVSNVSV
jgi:hypothetical protein